MAESRTVHVTAGCLAAGRPLSCRACAIALAVRAAFPDAEDVTVSTDTITWTRDGWREEYALDADVQYLIACIDNRADVVPFSFPFPARPAFRYRSVPVLRAAGRAA